MSHWPKQVPRPGVESVSGDLTTQGCGLRDHEHIRGHTNSLLTVLASFSHLAKGLHHKALLVGADQ